MLRLFIAITFRDDIKDALCQTIYDLLSLTSRGSFTAPDNLHLTLNFIGETNRAEEVKEIMQRAAAKLNIGSFVLTIGGFGRFRRREGDICWVGVEGNQSLYKLQKELANRLKAEDYVIDDQAYKPHLTLARRAVFKDKFSDAEFSKGLTPMNIIVDAIHLMKSERIIGKLVYTEIYQVKL